MKIRKIAVGLIAISCMTALLTGCGNNNDNNNDDDSDKTEQTNNYEVNFSSNGTIIDKVSVNENQTVAQPQDPSRDGYLFRGWYSDEACTMPFDFATSITSNTTIYAKWVEGTKYSVNFNDDCDGSTLEEAYSIKNTTLMEGCQLLGNQTQTIDEQTYKGVTISQPATLLAGKPKGDAVSVRVGGKGKVVFYATIDNEGETTLKVNNDKKKVVAEKTVSDNNLFTIEVEVSSETTLYLYADNSFTIYRVDSEWENQDHGTITSIEVTNTGGNHFIKGEDFDTKGLEVIATYDSGYEEVLVEGTKDNEFQVDYSSFKKDESGFYTINVHFKDFETDYTAYVYDIDSFDVDLYYMQKDDENLWGNSALRNVTNRQINYGNSQTFDTSALTIAVTGTVINEKNKEVSRLFKLSNAQYDLVCNDYNKDQEGNYVVNVETNFGNTTFMTYVIKETPKIINNTISVKVDQNYTGIVGKLDENNNHMFTTLNTAIEFLTTAEGIIDDVNKVIYVASGIYNEKVDVDIPNVTLIGENALDTIITFDAANGLQDPRGTFFGTDGSSTFGVRSTATNFQAKNITFESYYNTLERYNALKAQTTGTQALAIIIQADRSSFYNCRFTGFQDTVEMLGSGRQYFYNCYISGATDYIFGTNSSAMFENCEIHSISNGQSSNGGYICAPKGLNKGGDYTAFGYIFNNCRFTGDANITQNTTALARPWDDGATITIMNSVMDKHISTLPFNGTTQGRRYVAGLNGDWTADTAILREYNNTGIGSVNESQTYTNRNNEVFTIMEIITATEAQTLLENFWGAYTVTCPSNSKYDFTTEAWSKPIFE